MASMTVPTNIYASQGNTVIGVSVAFGCLSAVVITMRLWARVIVVRAVGPDDILMCIAFLLSWGFIIATILAVNHCLGDHIEAVLQRGTQNLITYAQIVWVSSIFYNATLGFIKTSVLALYMRLGDQTLRKLAIIMTVIVGSSATANVLVCIFQCSPVKAAWDTTITTSKCVDINAFYLANAATNICTDLLTYTLPIRLVIRLQMPFNQKIALTFMLCLGLFACVSSIVRITFIPRMLSSSDSTWAITNAMYWSVIETNIGILAASIPSFKPLAKRYLPKLPGEYSESGGISSSGGRSRPRIRGYGPFNKLSHGNNSVGLKSFGAAGGRDIKLTPGVSGRADLDLVEAGKLGNVETMIEQERVSNSSEERIIAPQGKIMARTQITRQVDGGSDAESYYNPEDGHGHGRAK